MSTSRIGSPDVRGPGSIGVRLLATGSAVPDGVLTNADLESMMDTSDEWITKRTGISERRRVDPATEGTFTLGRDAAARALERSGLAASDLDLIVFATVTAEMTCPSTACRVSDALGAAPAAAFDLVAACSGFVYGMNIADSLIRSGRHRRVLVIGCDTMTTVMDYDDRSVSILFGDAAGAAILEADEDPGRGSIYQSLQADGTMWPNLYLPVRERDVPPGDEANPIRLGNLRMAGREVYRFAVTKFQEVIQEALRVTGLTVDDIDQFVCHQSNVRIIDAAKDRLGLPDEKVHVNIDRYGNSSAGSVGLCLDELFRAGKVREGGTIMLIAFGGGLTWAASVWRV